MIKISSNISAVIVFVILAMLGESNVNARASTALTIATVRVGTDKRIHIIYSNQRQFVAGKEENQVDCDSAKIADDKRTAGWLVEYENCCTSYPIPLRLVIARGSRIIRRFHPPQAIMDWQFLKAGKLVAFWTGPLHGDFVPHFELHDVLSGRLMAEWNGHIEDDHPDWVTGLKE